MGTGYNQPAFAAGGAPPQMPYGQPQQYGQQQGMPQQGMPQQGMPQQGMPQQGMPQQGMPQQGQYGQQPMQGQMPPQQYGQQPMQGQMPQQGQYGQQPMQGQMPMGGQPPVQGQMPMQGQPPMQGQMPMGGAPQQYGQVGMNPPLNRVSLVKGQNMSLTKQFPSLRHARVGLGWDVRQTAGAAFDLDTSCFLLNAQNMVPNAQSFIFYNNKQSMDGSIMHCGDNLTGAGEGDDEQMSVDLTRVPQDIQRIVFVCSIYEAEQRNQNFGMVQRAFIRICDQDTQQEIVRFDLTEEACMMSCMQFGELYRYGTEWKFKALGTPVQGGLRGAGAQFGMQLA